MAEIVDLSRIQSTMSILGTTKAQLWPFVEATGISVSGVGLSVPAVPSESGGSAEALEDDFGPWLHSGGVHTYDFDPTGDHHLAIPDNGDLSHGDGSDDSALSFGAIILPKALSENTVLAKYDSAGNKEEYRWGIDNAGKMELELHDASASATETGVADTVLTLHQPVFVVVTYDGTNATPKVLHYKNGVLDSDPAGATTESGSYVAMENTSAPATIGCAGVTATPTLEFHGRIGGVFSTGKELSAAEVFALWNIYKSMYGWLT